MNLDQYVLLGRSGLRVSPIALGTMTFGEQFGWGAPKQAARALFDLYVGEGGNFVDTADLYTEGTSETWLGDFVKDSGLRDQLVIATKYTYGSQAGNPNAGGNQRKHLMRALDASLKRLQTDYIDLYYLHTWDRLTPVEEVMRTMDDAVRAGKIRYVGLSDTPAWYASRAQTLAQWRGWEPVAAMQLEYSMIERNAELEFADLSLELGMGLVPWSPLAMGLLSGKYKPSDKGRFGEGRLQLMANHPTPGFDRLTERNFAIVAALEQVAKEADVSMAQAALYWLARKKGVSSIIVGATQLQQLQESLGATRIAIAPELLAKLDAASEPAKPFPYYMFADGHQSRIHNGVEVASAAPTHAPPMRIPAAAKTA
jgi:aryl-alcohol dehydrogenase-like predicted oxidoreductase